MLSLGLQRFVRRNIVSVEQLEILLLLFDDPAKGWRADEISRRLRSSMTSVAKRLGDLSRRRLIVEENGNYCYVCDDRIDEQLEELRAAYQVSPSRVIDLIFSESDAALSSFADAFRLRPEDSDRDR